MNNYTSELMRVLDERGYIHQVTDAAGLDALAARQIVPGYIGFDATAPSLHIGSLVQIMMLRRLQQAGHKPVVLMGGGTTRIGDPTGRDESRKMLTDETIAANIEGIRTVFERLLTFGEGPTDAVMVDNQDWLGELGYIEMLQKVGTHFTVNRMLTFDSVRLRLEREQPMTFLEFNYMILQGYDFRHLAQDMGVRLQMGGSDQWGNIVNGMELGRRMDGSELFGLTTPLLTTADGGKMGKTASGAVWLNEAQLPNYDFWQYWRNVDDRDVGRFLRLFTDLDLAEIARLEALEGAQINEAKTVLANEVTTLVRGAEAARLAERTAAETFAGGGAGSDLPTLAVGADGMRIGAVLTELGFTASNGEAKRKLAEGAVKLDGAVITEPGHLVTVAQGSECKLSLGKKKHAIIRAQ
ncbi:MULTISPECIES: tyrosine--tRNA ligase [Qipengyuania]|jgi:tyrosyl-tRNA synthetase|uniref:Tyrosine--tRNA ligase n=1 Tax=Qipengyuania citrea LAMA 915 TaxID=1306953 RepID=A0A0L1KD47_9SPHN|nr:tyrosine--tRNA ligase [Qipengyuania citrea]KNH01856.1 tyrosyl-trna synthetase [Qipengyuania citrea LAMA 915]MDP7325150.1 tyrosine--tRNA ligase [Qipengyuania citrea]HBC14423.1 tyrosine--tRNA ligase [Erythrobacter sp.]|tara:strand:+ start:1553 stop:2785 length:1233 start_codon:yes stop_codon:yes gene_type:complete